MKHTALFLLMAAATVAASAQTTAAKPATTSSTAARPATTAHASTATGIKLPPGVPPVRGILKTAFALKYQDIKIGTGADAEKRHDEKAAAGAEVAHVDADNHHAEDQRFVVASPA